MGYKYHEPPNIPFKQLNKSGPRSRLLVHLLERLLSKRVAAGVAGNFHAVDAGAAHVVKPGREKPRLYCLRLRVGFIG